MSVIYRRTDKLYSTSHDRIYRLLDPSYISVLCSNRSKILDLSTEIKKYIHKCSNGKATVITLDSDFGIYKLKKNSDLESDTIIDEGCIPIQGFCKSTNIEDEEQYQTLISNWTLLKYKNSNPIKVLYCLDYGVITDAKYSIEQIHATLGTEDILYSKTRIMYISVRSTVDMIGTVLGHPSYKYGYQYMSSIDYDTIRDIELLRSINTNKLDEVSALMH